MFCIACTPGNSFGLDREALAKSLGFSKITPNSLDGVSDRDFIAEFLFWASMLMVHFSQLSEDLIIYNTLVRVCVCYGFILLLIALS